MMKKILLTALDHAREQVANDKCTGEQMDAWVKIIKKHMALHITADEAANLFDRPKELIHASVRRHRYGNKLRLFRKSYFNAIELFESLPRTWFK